MLGLHELELGHFDLRDIEYADLPEMPVIIKERYDVHEGEDGIILFGGKGQLTLPGAGLFTFRFLFHAAEELDVFFCKQTIHRRADNLPLVFDLEQLDRAVIAIGDHERLGVEDKDPIEGSIIDRVYELFLLEDRLFVIAVDAYDSEREEGGKQQGQDQVAVIKPREHVYDMDLVVILLRTIVITEKNGYDRHQVRKGKLFEIPGEADDKRHDQEVGEEEQVFPGLEPFHIVHDGEIEIQIEHRDDPGKQVFFAEIEMISEYEKIGGAEVDQCADIKAETEVGDHADKVRTED